VAVGQRVSDPNTASGNVTVVQVPAKPKNKKLLVILALVVVVLAAAGFVLGPKLLKKPSGKPVRGAILALPQITTNLAGGQLLQVTVALQLSTAANVKQAKADIPRLANAEIAVFGSETYSELLTSKGRAQAKELLLKRFQAILPAVGKGKDAVPQVMQVLFTDFVEQ